MRRDYGSDLPRLIDRPINSETLLDLYMATAEALDRWEPRVSVNRITADQAASGQLALALDVTVSGVEQLIELELGGAAS